MIWAKREFSKSTGDYGSYQERFADLHRDLGRIAGMMMVKADKGPHLCDVIISLPDAGYLSMFEGFKVIDEGSLPKEASILYVDHATDDFERRFRIPSGTRGSSTT
jgi:hypothetical protein